MALTQQTFSSDRAQIATEHSRQRFWQVLFPVVLASLLVISLLGYFIFSSRGNGVLLEQMGGVAAIILILPALLGLFLALVFLAVLIFLTTKLTGIIPDLAKQAVYAFAQARTEIQKISDGATDPIIKLKQYSAKLNQLFESLHKRI